MQKFIQARIEELRKTVKHEMLNSYFRGQLHAYQEILCKLEGEELKKSKMVAGHPSNEV